MKNLNHCLFAIGLVLVMPNAVLAEDHVVSEKNKNFSVKKLTIKVGDSVTFINEDKGIHNVFAEKSQNNFDIGTQYANAKDSVKFSRAGKVKVRCRIHPQMRMTINVQ